MVNGLMVDVADRVAALPRVALRLLGVIRIQGLRPCASLP
jgi:hypothetical protein